MLKRNTWEYLTECALSLLDRNSWYHITPGKKNESRQNKNIILRMCNIVNRVYKWPINNWYTVP